MWGAFGPEADGAGAPRRRTNWLLGRSSGVLVLLQAEDCVEATMDRRRILQIGVLVWAAIGASVALASLGSVNADARLFVGAFSVAGPLAAVGAAWLLGRGADRAAGALLLLSVLTPTYFAYVLNLPALLLGLALVVAPHAVLPGNARARASSQLA